MSAFRLSFLLLLLTLLHTSPTTAQTPADRRVILGTLARQAADWNAGRVAEFMTAYWPSDSLTFVGTRGVTYGYAATMANYKKRYPDRASMGTLDFSNLKLHFPAQNVAYVIGHWHLTRPKVGDAQGQFTLLWEKKKGRWLIVSDHSS